MFYKSRALRRFNDYYYDYARSMTCEDFKETIQATIEAANRARKAHSDNRVRSIKSMSDYMLMLMLTRGCIHIQNLSYHGRQALDRIRVSYEGFDNF